MRIVTASTLEDCFVDSLTSELDLDGPLTEAFIRWLGREGHLQYVGHLPRPFFRIDVPDRYSLSGIQGNHRFRVTLCHDRQAANLRHLETVIESFAG